MATHDNCCTVVPYFKVYDGKMEAFKDISQQLVERARQEPNCLFYGFSFSGDEAHCREGYHGAQGVLEHLANCGPLIKEILEVSDITRHEIHGPAEEVDKLREALAEVPTQFFILEHGFRR
ncbi:MAG: hypothetical protein KQI62_13950 [Deltaproteobacteria bacterium]|nr:hypothetical protein [Deltaproteobacteria bacterium]